MKTMPGSEKRNCRACAHSYMEPDTELICGHKFSGSFGTYVHRVPAQHCLDLNKFEQHPHRKTDGSLK